MIDGELSPDELRHCNLGEFILATAEAVRQKAAVHILSFAVEPRRDELHLGVILRVLDQHALAGTEFREWMPLRFFANPAFDAAARSDQLVQKMLG